MLVIQHNPRTRMNPGLQRVSARPMTPRVVADTPVGLSSPFIGNHGVCVKF